MQKKLISLWRYLIASAVPAILLTVVLISVVNRFELQITRNILERDGIEYISQLLELKSAIRLNNQQQTQATLQQLLADKNNKAIKDIYPHVTAAVLLRMQTNSNNTNKKSNSTYRNNVIHEINQIILLTASRSGLMIAPDPNNHSLIRLFDESPPILSNNSMEFKTITLAKDDNPELESTEWVNELKNRLVQQGEELRQQLFYSTIGTLVALIFILLAITSYYKQNRRVFHKLVEYSREIEELSITDPMTGLYNRRHFDVISDRELRRASRHKDSFTITVVDIDYFKSYNDTYGHQAGDEVLCKVADKMQTFFKRAGDFVFRIGGEEFCIIFTGENLEPPASYIKKFCSEIEKMNIEHSSSKVSDFITVSIGLYFMEKTDTEDVEIVFKKADDALYKAKNDGRNRVCINKSIGDITT